MIAAVTQHADKLAHGELAVRLDTVQRRIIRLRKSAKRKHGTRDPQYWPMDMQAKLSNLKRAAGIYAKALECQA